MPATSTPYRRALGVIAAHSLVSACRNERGQGPLRAAFRQHHFRCAEAPRFDASAAPRHTSIHTVKCMGRQRFAMHRLIAAAFGDPP